jgi:hypothetical protein
MKRLSHSKVRLSMQLLGTAAVAAAALGFTTMASSAPSGSSGSPYFGRWQVNEPDSRFSARGRAYKIIDIAPCGHDFCGVSVSDNGQCGQTLFRFLSAHRDGSTRLLGHAVWGTGKKDITIDAYDAEAPETTTLELYIGNGHDFGERGGSMPMFNAAYDKHGAAQCRSR